MAIKVITHKGKLPSEYFVYIREAGTDTLWGSVDKMHRPMLYTSLWSSRYHDGSQVKFHATKAEAVKRLTEAAHATAFRRAQSATR